jgi:hypothetical protein
VAALDDGARDDCPVEDCDRGFRTPKQSFDPAGKHSPQREKRPNDERRERTPRGQAVPIPRVGEAAAETGLERRQLTQRGSIERADERALHKSVSPQRVHERLLVPAGFQIEMQPGGGCLLREKPERFVERRHLRCSETLALGMRQDERPVRAIEDVELDEIDTVFHRSSERLKRVRRRKRRGPTVTDPEQAALRP